MLGQFEVEALASAIAEKLAEKLAPKLAPVIQPIISKEAKRIGTGIFLTIVAAGAGGYLLREHLHKIYKLGGRKMRENPLEDVLRTVVPVAVIGGSAYLLYKLFKPAPSQTIKYLPTPSIQEQEKVLNTLTPEQRARFIARYNEEFIKRMAKYYLIAKLTGLTKDDFSTWLSKITMRPTA